MQIQLNNPFVAFDEFHSHTPLPEFTLITGLNGAGKTRLLQGISEGYAHVDTSDGEVGIARLYNPCLLYTSDAADE